VVNRRLGLFAYL